MKTSTKEEKKKSTVTHLNLPQETFNVLIKEARKNKMFLWEYVTQLCDHKALEISIKNK